jgi:hypothetical protein
MNGKSEGIIVFAHTFIPSDMADITTSDLRNVRISTALLIKQNAICPAERRRSFSLLFLISVIAYSSLA